MYELPITVSVGGIEYSIRDKADYRTILGVIDVCQDPELTQEEQTVSAFLIFYETLSTIEDIYAVFGDNIKEAGEKMMSFIGMENTDDIVKPTSKIKLIDWQQDETLIVSAINNVAKTEIRALPYLHWWTFIGYYMSIGESSLSTVVNIRSKIAKGKKLEKYEQEFRRENPQYFYWKRQKQEADNLLSSIWNKGE